MSVFIPTSGGGGASDYLEFGWVCAPNAAGQSMTANTLQTLTIDTEIQDAGGHGSISSNQITLAAGTYYFDIVVPLHSTEAGYTSVILGLRKDPSGTPSFVARLSSGNLYNCALSAMTSFNGQFTITSSTVFDITALTTGTCAIKSGVYNSAFTEATAGADQRTTIKLWKLA
jgi:hypothetical protein